jgi:type IV pilus assembly protein PilX
VIHVTQPVPKKQQGLVLVTSLLMLVVVTLLAVALFRSFGTDEKIAGNTREKQRALNAAETAEQAAEAWLQGGAGGGATTACAAPLLIFPASQICTQTFAAQNLDPTVLPWTMGVKYSAPTMVTGSTGSGTYINPPQYYVAFLGAKTVSNITTSYYQIDAVGYGANANAAAVVESTYTTTAGPGCKSCP